MKGKQNLVLRSAGMIDDAVYEFRVTRYDPSKRDFRGGLRKETWTSITDVGRTFGDTTLTMEEYEKVEQAYVRTALDFIAESGGDGLRVCGLEKGSGFCEACGEGDFLKGEQLAEAFRCVLRELCWCRFRDTAGRFVHFGYDYYMYVGLPHPCSEARRAAVRRGLFVEPFSSPYKHRID